VVNHSEELVRAFYEALAPGHRERPSGLSARARRDGAGA